VRPAGYVRTQMGTNWVSSIDSIKLANSFRTDSKPTAITRTRVRVYIHVPKGGIGVKGAMWAIKSGFWACSYVQVLQADAQLQTRCRTFGWGLAGHTHVYNLNRCLLLGNALKFCRAGARTSFAPREADRSQAPQEQTASGVLGTCHHLCRHQFSRGSKPPHPKGTEPSFKNELARRHSRAAVASDSTG